MSDGSETNPYTYFYFGGFGNNYVDNGSVKRYRDYYSFPGFEINELAGKEYYRTMLEWNLPPVRYRNVGNPGFYLTHMRPAIFASSLVTDSDNGVFEGEYENIGFQLDFKFMVMHRLSMTLSVGYAKSFIGGSDYDDEWMLSLKIM